MKECPARLCVELIPDDRDACKRHWEAVSEETRKQVAKARRARDIHEARRWFAQAVHEMEWAR